jgi:hypothetical protein
MPEIIILIGLVSHDGTGSSWVKLDFTNGTATLVEQSDVDPDAPNTGWFVFYNNAGTPEFRDARVTSVGLAKMAVDFTVPYSSIGYLAPGPGLGNYLVIVETHANAYHFFWADNTSTGYGSMDNNDYFGVIKVDNITDTGPYRASLEIYIQHNVPGLRWVKF